MKIYIFILAILVLLQLSASMAVGKNTEVMSQTQALDSLKVRILF